MSYRSDFKNCKHHAQRFLDLAKEFEEQKKSTVAAAKLHKTARILERSLRSFNKKRQSGFSVEIKTSEVSE